MDTATCYLMSDPTRNRHFHRRWSEPRRPMPPQMPAPALATADAEPGLATLLRWQAEWRAERAARSSGRKAAP